MTLTDFLRAVEGPMQLQMLLIEFIFRCCVTRTWLCIRMLPTLILDYAALSQSTKPSSTATVHVLKKHKGLSVYCNAKLSICIHIHKLNKLYGSTIKKYSIVKLWGEWYTYFLVPYRPRLSAPFQTTYRTDHVAQQHQSKQMKQLLTLKNTNVHVMWFEMCQQNRGLTLSSLWLSVLPDNRLTVLTPDR